jgi:MFS family permease
MNIVNKIMKKVNLKRFSPGMWTAMGIQAIRTTGFSISFSYLPLYLHQQRHIAMTLVGLIILITGLISGGFNVVGGVLADRFGHRKTFIICQVIETMMFALLAVLMGINAAVWFIFVISILVSMAGGMSAPAISAMVTDAAQNQNLAESYGLMAIGGNLGWAIGPLTGGLLLAHYSYAWVFGAGAVVTALSLFGTAYLPRDGAGKHTGLISKNSLKLFLSDSTMIIFCLLCLLFFFEMSQWGATLSVFSVDHIGFTPEQYGLLMSISGVLIIIFQYPISRRIAWLGSRKSLFLGSVLYGLGFLSLTWVKSFLPAVGSIVILVAGEMLFVPTSNSAIARMSRPEDIGKNMGILGLCATIGASCGPLLGGFLLDKFPDKPLFVWGPIAIPVFAAAVGFLLWRGYSRTEVNDKNRR